jgi:hypothetical protein
LWTAVPGLLTVGLTLLLREARHEIREPVPFDWRIGTFPPAFRRYLAVLGLFTLGYPSSLFLLLPAFFLFGGISRTFAAAHAFGFSAVCAVSAALLLMVWCGR